MNKPKVLCYMNHYYNVHGNFNGKSTNSTPTVRKQIVEKTLKGLRELDNCDVKVCGIEGYSLINLDITFNFLKDSRMLIFASVIEMSNHIAEYEYFINIEDDIFITNDVLKNVYEFDQISQLNEIFLPNRLEVESGNVYCVDTSVCFPGWINTEKRFKNKLLKIAINPHSGILILRNIKFSYAISNIQEFKMDINSLDTEEIVVKFEKEGPFAHFHRPFCLYRSKDDIEFHSVHHLDKWAPKKKSFLYYFQSSSIKRYIKVIPMRLKFPVENIL